MSREDWPTAGKSLRALTGFIHLRINPPYPPLRKGKAGDLKGGKGGHKDEKDFVWSHHSYFPFGDWSHSVACSKGSHLFESGRLHGCDCRSKRPCGYGM